MVEKYSELRLGLLGLGFISQNLNGTLYKTIVGDKTFLVFLDAGTMNAVYPDYEYNKNNPYSTKDIQIDYTWNKEETNACILANIVQFMNDVCNNK
jgi:hypothetical protein